MPTIISMPSAIRFRESRFLLRANTQTHRSPLSQSAQTQILTGSRWMATYRLPAMKRAAAEEICAFLTRLNGMGGRFYGYDPAARTPRGTPAGTPLVYGAGQTGTVLLTYGWTPAASGVLLLGDYISFPTPSGWQELHKVVETPAAVTSGGYGEYGSGGYGAGGYGLPSGGLALTIAPPIRESPAADAAITTTNATCVMMLSSDEEAAWDVSLGLIFGIEFDAEEVFG